jgi:hypothetical protein
MLRKSALTLTTIAALGLAGVVPNAASAGGLGGGFSGRIGSSVVSSGFQSGVRIGNNGASNVGRSPVQLTSQNHLNHFAGASALITEVTVPKLDAASKDAAYFNIKFAQPHIVFQNQGCRLCTINRFR